MVLKPIARRTVHGDVFEQLLEEVVGGDVAAGQSLPSERRLAELLGVSRPAVREAMQRLAQAGLVEVRHGGSTLVRDFRTSAGLDLLPRLLVREGVLDPRVGLSILEARQAIAPAVAVLASQRPRAARQEAQESLRASVATLEAAEGPVARQHAALAFWDAVVDVADSIVFRLLFNSLRHAYEPTIDALAPVMGAEVDNVAGYRDLCDAVVAGDEVAAQRAAEDLLRPATEAIGQLLTALEHDDSPRRGNR